MYAGAVFVVVATPVSVDNAVYFFLRETLSSCASSILIVSSSNLGSVKYSVFILPAILVLFILAAWLSGRWAGMLRQMVVSVLPSAGYRVK